MTFIAVDDEPLALVVIERFAKQSPEWQLLGTFTDVTLAIDFVKSNIVDLVISDINMPDINGIQFVKQLSHEKPQVIFITAHKEHALEGFDLDVTDYLMKPISIERFQKAMNKAAKLATMEKSIANIPFDNHALDHFFVFSEYEQIKIVFHDILYIEAMGDYVKIFLKSQSKPVLTLERVKNLADSLDGKGFLRIHRSFIINLTHLEAKQKARVRINDTWLPVGETFQKEWLNHN